MSGTGNKGEPVTQENLVLPARGLSGGELSVDPTENVKALQEAGAKRQDDLRELNDRRIDAEIRVLAAQLDGLEKRMVLRAEHAKEIRLLESDRLEKIRQVDVLAGNTAADRALVAIQTLATTQNAAAEAMREMVTQTATTIAAQHAADLARINEQIAALQKTSYEGAGKQTIADPMMAELVAEMKAMRATVTSGEGQSTGRKDMWGYVVAGFSFVGMLIAMFYALSK
jgi:hypothetical protein